MKLFNLILITLLSVAMLTGCGGGGGGGGGNPAGPAYSEQLASEFPGISSSYTTMQSALQNNSQDLTARLNSFMAVIADPFFDKSNNSNRNDLRAVTESRLDRYEVVQWSLTPFSHTKVDDNTVTVSTKMVIQVNLKPGKEGSAGTLPYNFGDTSKGEPALVFTWVKEGDGEWRIQKGLLYRQDELF